MTGSTAQHAIPYAVGADPLAAVDTIMQALAEAVDALLPVTVRKLLDESVTSSTVLQNDDHLFFPVVAGKQYTFDFFLIFTTGSSAIDAKLALTFPAGVCTWGVLGLDPAAGAGSVGQVTAAGSAGAASGTALSVGVSAGTTIARLTGTFTCTTTGTLRLQWAQNTSTASAMTLQNGSHVNYRQIG